MKASITEKAKFELEKACRRRLPYETCGVLFGRSSGSGTAVDGFSVVRNASIDPRRSFSFDPADWVRAGYEAQKNQREIVGFFHSHPNGTVHPSEADVSGMPPGGTYWIVGCGTENECDIAVYGPHPDTGLERLHLCVSDGLNTRKDRLT